ncbi:MAG TPA: energy transducer TonB [Allosphingosinicella sp.]|uniref:energy transducer TonB n=1 Tax=Allosphingosinicella sp. TaxID=2823234 RepID=UPI002ED9BD06
MMQLSKRTRQDRIKALIGVTALHALLGYAFITGLAYEVVHQVSDNLKVFDITDPPPPPEEKPEPVRLKEPEPEGAAAPPSIKAVVAPKPKIELPVPPPVRTAPASGNADIVGTGTGSGGTGNGTGSGGSGTGTGGGGGGGSKAVREQGGFTRRDYARIAGPTRLRGTVYVRYTVQPSGRVSGCAVTRSSGYPQLDAATCGIIEQRFRYRPARDGQGKAVAETKQTSFDWAPD